MKLKGSLSQAGSSLVLNDGATTQATITAVNVAAAVFTLPAATDTLVGRASTDTLTNKTFTSPVLTTPNLGVATATSINKVAITAPATSATLTLADGSSLITSGAFAITLTATAGTGVTLPTTGTLATLAGAETFTNKTLTSPKLNENVAVTTTATKLNYLTSAGGTTGTASTNVVFSTSPTLVTPVLGAATATTVNKVTITAPTSSATLTIADGASLITAGAYAVTLTATNTTGVTLPTTGTLATLDGTETFTAKTLTSPKINENVSLTTTATKLNYLTSAGGTTGTTSTNVVFSTSPTLVTPVLGAATATTINKVTITQPASGSTLTIVDGGSLITAGAFAITLTATGATGVTLPTTGTLSTNAGAEVHTNKDHDGGTASNTSRLTVPKAALSTLTALTRKQGTIVYDTTANALLADDGSNLNSIGGGSGEKNYVTAPSTASGWATSDVNAVTVATDVTSSIPRPNTSKSALLITGVTGTVGYIYYRFILDDSDAGKKLKFQFDMRPGTAVASDFEVRVYSNTANDYTTGNTRLSLSTDNSTPASLLPALTGTYRTTFDAPAVTAKYIEVRIKMAASNVHTLYISDVIVGPGVVTQGAAVSQWTAYTPTYGTGFGTTVHVGAESRRVGDTMELRGRFTTGTVASSTASITPPSGYTMSPTTANNYVVGRAAHTGTVKDFTVIFDNSTNLLQFAIAATESYTGVDNGSTFSSSQSISWDAKVKIAEWAGSGTVNVVQNDVEYVYNSGTWDATDSTTFGYGPSGGAIGGALTADRVKTVSFANPIAVGDAFDIQFQVSSTSAWVSSWCFGTAFAVQNGVNYGCYLITATIGANTALVNFERYAYPNGASFGAAGQAWSSAWRWRVVKYKTGQAIGFSEVVPGTSSGLVSASGLKGATAAATVATGYVGERLTGTNDGTNGISTSYARAASISVTAGVWMIWGWVNIASGNFTVPSVAISTSTSSLDGSGDETTLPGNNTSAATKISLIARYVNISATTTYNAIGKGATTVANPTMTGMLYAVRIA